MNRKKRIRSSKHQNIMCIYISPFIFLWSKTSETKISTIQKNKRKNKVPTTGTQCKYVTVAGRPKAPLIVHSFKGKRKMLLTGHRLHREHGGQSTQVILCEMKTKEGEKNVHSEQQQKKNFYICGERIHQETDAAELGLKQLCVSFNEANFAMSSG